MDETIDPLGRTVHLAEERWQHIIDGHPYMTPFRAEVLRAVEAPTDRSSSRGPARPGLVLPTGCRPKSVAQGRSSL